MRGRIASGSRTAFAKMLPAEAQEAPETNADSGRDREDPGLAQLSLPAGAVKRLAKIAAPGNRFTTEALAGIQRVAQAYVMFATHGALSQVKSEGAAMNKAKKGQKPQPSKKTLQAEHVMRFLSSEMPQLASKLSSLFPDYVPEEFKPPSVQLLEQLHQQLGASSMSQAEPPETQSPSRHSEKDVVPSNVKRPAEATELGNNSKRRKAASKTDQVSPGKQAGAKAPPSKPRSLTSFFGAAAPRPAAQNEEDVSKVQMEEDPGKSQREQDVSIVRREVEVCEAQTSIARREVEVAEDAGDS